MPTTVQRARSKSPWSYSKTVNAKGPAVPSYHCGGTPGLRAPEAIRALGPTALPVYTRRMAYTESLFPGKWPQSAHIRLVRLIRLIRLVRLIRPKTDRITFLYGGLANLAVPMYPCATERDGSKATTGRAEVAAHEATMGRRGRATCAKMCCFNQKSRFFFTTVVGINIAQWDPPFSGPWPNHGAPKGPKFKMSFFVFLQLFAF